jgi:MFS family permease
VICQDVAFALAGPFWGSLADNGFPRKTLLCLGAGGWSLLSLTLAFVSTFEMMAILRCMNGTMLGMLVPIVQSIVADESEVRDRGYNFGWIDMCNKAIGQTVAIFAVTSMSNMTIFGMDGWRVAFLAVGVLSLVLALAVALLMQEKPRSWKPERVGIIVEAKKFMGYFQIPTFNVISLQGMFGTIPYAAMTFGTMYFQYRGLLDWQAAIVMGTLSIGGGLGSMVGGIIGDKMHRYSSTHGRPMTAQLSVLLGIPIVYVTFTCHPPPGSRVHVLAGLVFMLGLVCSWCSAGCNKPIFLEIIPKDSVASAMAWQSCLEHACGHFIGPMAVGYISEQVFSYSIETEQVSSMTPVVQEHNANSLGNAIAISTVLPWIACFCLYGFLHITYTLDNNNCVLPADDAINDDIAGASIDETTKLLF